MPLSFFRCTLSLQCLGEGLEANKFPDPDANKISPENPKECKESDDAREKEVKMRAKNVLEYLRHFMLAIGGDPKSLSSGYLKYMHSIQLGTREDLLQGILWLNSKNSELQYCKRSIGRQGMLRDVTNRSFTRIIFTSFLAENLRNDKGLSEAFRHTKLKDEKMYVVSASFTSSRVTRPELLTVCVHITGFANTRA